MATTRHRQTSEQQLKCLARSFVLRSPSDCENFRSRATYRSPPVVGATVGQFIYTLQFDLYHNAFLCLLTLLLLLLVCAWHMNIYLCCVEGRGAVVRSPRTLATGEMQIWGGKNHCHNNNKSELFVLQSVDHNLVRTVRLLAVWYELCYFLLLADFSFCCCWRCYCYCCWEFLKWKSQRSAHATLLELLSCFFFFFNFAFVSMLVGSSFFIVMAHSLSLF